MFLYTYSIETVQNHLYKTCFRIACKLSYNLLNMVKKVQKQDGFMCPGDSGGLFEHIGFEYKTQWTNTHCNTVHGEGINHNRLIPIVKTWLPVYVAYRYYPAPLY